MKFNELFTTPTTGIFTVFSTDYPDEFKTLFGRLTAYNLNQRAIQRYGNRTLASYVNDTNYMDIVKTCIELNSYAWIKSKEALTTSGYNLTGHTITRSKTGGETFNRNDNGTNTTAKKPFNESTFNDEEKDARVNDTKESREYNLTDSANYADNGRTVIDSIQKEINLRKIRLQERIIRELVNELTLTIYE